MIDEIELSVFPVPVLIIIRQWTILAGLSVLLRVLFYRVFDGHTNAMQ